MHNILDGNTALESFENNQINSPTPYLCGDPSAAAWLLHLDSAPLGSLSLPHVHILQDQLISNTVHTRRAEHNTVHSDLRVVNSLIKARKLKLWSRSIKASSL